MPRSLGITSLQILAAVQGGDAYGLDIVVQTGLPSGTVYPTLGRLKKRGLVRARWEPSRIAERAGRPRRRYYELTSDGAVALAAGAERVRRMASEIQLAPRGDSA